MGGESSTEEKQFAPSEQKLRKALEEGNALFIPPINSGIVLIVGIILIGELTKVISLLYNSSFDLLFKLTNKGVSQEDFAQGISSTLMMAALTIIAMVFAFSVISFMLSVIQVKGIRFVPLKLRFESLNILETAKQKFTKKTVVKLIIELIFIATIFIIELLYLTKSIKSLVNMIYLDFSKQVVLFSEMIYGLVFMAIICLVVYLCILYVIEKSFYIKNLMMTRQEIKQEVEDSEGKAEVKGRIRELRNELMEDDSYLDAILTDYSSFVISNPTHYGIVIFYAKDILPIVMLKGKNEIAKKIISRAKKLGIPVIQNRYLARMLYELINPGEPVPKSLITEMGKLIGANYEIIAPFVKDKAVLNKPYSK